MFGSKKKAESTSNNVGDPDLMLITGTMGLITGRAQRKGVWGHMVRRSYLQALSPLEGAGRQNIVLGKTEPGC